MANADFLSAKQDPPATRCDAAIASLNEERVSAELVLSWISASLWKESSFVASREAWTLLNTVILRGGFREDRFTFTLKPQVLASIEDKDTRELAFSVTERLSGKIQNAWRPKSKDLILSLAECLSRNLGAMEIHFLVRTTMLHHEFVAAIDQIFKQTVDSVFQPLLANTNPEIDRHLMFEFLAAAICVPFFVQKAVNDITGKVTMQVVKILDSEAGAKDFVPFFIRAFFDQTKLLNMPIDLVFPLELIRVCRSLDMAPRILGVCREERIYTVERESKSLSMLEKLAERAVAERNGKVLTELCGIDFRVVRPHLYKIMSDAMMSDEQVSLAILDEARKQRNLLIIFECGEFPEHVIANGPFIRSFCDSVKFMVSAQLSRLLDHLIGFPDHTPESALLFWAIQSAQLTAEHEQAVDTLIANCYQNAWRYTAAVIGAKKLRRQMPVPMPFVTDADTDPVILHCFTRENYGMLMIGDLPAKNAVVPQVPYPGMPNRDAFRTAFIIQNLPSIVDSLEAESLVMILRFIVTNALAAKDIVEPKTVADCCMAVLGNSYFYESKVIMDMFPQAVLPILPKRHFSSDQEITAELQLLCAVVASMPQEFTAPVVALGAFIGMFRSCEGMSKCAMMADPPSELFSEISIGTAMCNIAPLLRASSVVHNLDRIFANCPDDIIEQLMPILFHIAGRLPSAETNKVSQVVAICDYCAATRTPLPYDCLAFPDDMVAFCAQLKAGSEQAIEFLLGVDMSVDNVAVIIHAITQMDQVFVENLGDEFLAKMAQLATCVENMDAKDIGVFSSRLSVPTLARFLDVANVSMYPSILQFVKLAKDVFDERFACYVLEIVRSSPPPSVIKTVCTFKFARYYGEDVVEHIMLLISSCSQANEALADICLLCGCVVQLARNCPKEVSRFAILTDEITRRLSNEFASRVAKENPTYKHLRALAKLYSAVARGGRADYAQYLIASFVSHIAHAQVDNIKLRLWQSAIFPLFERCSRTQLSEVSVALHDSHRQVFRHLHERWTAESQYHGKV